MVRSLLGMCLAGIVAIPMPALAQQTEATPAPATQAAPAPAEKVRCKRYVETGTLAKMHKECHTEAEWQRVSEANRQTARDMVGSASASGASPK